MAVGRCIALIVELVLLIAILGLSLTAVSTISLLKLDFNGECPLFPTIDGDIGWFNFKTNDVINCNYVIGANAASALLCVLIVIFATIEAVKKKRVLSFMPFLKIVLALIMTVLAAVSVGIVTIGFQKLCSGLATMVDFFHDYDTCKEWQQDDYWHDIYEYNGSHFYNYLFAAQISSGINAGLWIIICILSCLSLAFCNSRSVEDDDIALIL